MNDATTKPPTFPVVLCQKFPTGHGKPIKLMDPFGYSHRSAGALQIRPCRYFAEGRCRHGARCGFSHQLDYPERPRPEIPLTTSAIVCGQDTVDGQTAPRCHYFLKGHCRKGAACSFAHTWPDHDKNEGLETEVHEKTSNI